MINPYETPQSELDSSISQLRKKTGWKIFFWFCCSVQVLAMVSIFFFVESPPTIDMVGDTAVYAFVLIGLFSFAYNKRVVTPAFWRVVILIAIAWDCYNFVDNILNEAYAGLDVYLKLAIIIPQIIFSFLQYFALYQYAFRSKEIWNESWVVS